MFFKFKAQ
jgi:hypothetical protein